MDCQKALKGSLQFCLSEVVVASALSVAGTLVTEFKLGYWAGASPKRIQWSCILACLLASVVVTGTIMILNTTYGFDPAVKPGALEAPQANLMKSALDSFLGTGEVPWIPYGVGVMLALLLELVKISPLAFGLGMYLPMSLNAPILIGALVSSAVKKGGSDDLKRARGNKGIIIASGLIAGAAITGVILSGLRAIPTLKFVSQGIGDFVNNVFYMIDIPAGIIMNGRDPESVGRMFNWFGMIAFLLLCLFIFWDSRRAKADAAGPDIHM